MSQYLVLLYEDEAGFTEGGEAAHQRAMEEHFKFQQDNAKSVVGGNALQSVGTATSIRSDGAGGFSVTDGPFAETKEALGGYYLIEAADLDEALAIARQVPARFGGIEVRPIRVFD